MRLWDFCIRRPVFTTVLTGGLVLFGVLGYLRMGVDLYPDVEFPVVSISTVLEGASPEVVDQDVTEIIEEEVGTLEGIESIRSQSLEGRSRVIVEFSLYRDVDVAAQEVRDRVASARRRLPVEAEPPVVEKADLSARPILWLAVTGEGPYQRLRYFAEKVVKERVQGLPGVGGVVLGGFRQRALRVWLDLDRLAGFGLGPNDVVRALRRWQADLPGGRVENRLTESTVKVEGEFSSVEALGDLVVAWQGARDGGTGAPVRLSQVARLEDGQEDQRSVARYTGIPSIGVGIRKQSKGNTVAVARAVKAALPDIRAELPDWVSVQVAYDASRFVEASLSGARFDILFGALFTCVVIYLFLGSFRTTLISVIAIPTSLVGAFFLLHQAGASINQMTLLGMALAVGLVVDDAIVVLESIHRARLHGPGGGGSAGPEEAASRGTAEVGFAVMAATASIAVIFLPVGFMGGVVGQFFGEFGLTVALTIGISLLVSLTLTPMLASRWASRTGKRQEGVAGPLMHRVEALYGRVLRWCVSSWKGRGTVLGVAGGLFAALVVLPLASGALGREFIPTADDSRFMIVFETPMGSSLEVTDARVRQAEEILFSHDAVQGAFMAVGLFSGQPNRGLFFVTLKPPRERDIRQQDLMNRLRGQLNAIPGFVAFPSPINPLGGGGATRSSDIQYVLLGPDLARLEEMAEELVGRLQQDPVFQDVDHDLELTRPQVSVWLDRDAAARVGLDTREIAAAVQAVMGGVNAAKFKEGGDQFDIRVKAAERFRSSAGDIRRILVRTPRGNLLRLGSLARVEEGLGPNTINRYNRQRSVTVQANVQGTSVGEATRRFTALAREVMGSAPGYRLVPAGQSKTMAESLHNMGFALVMAVLVVYMVLAAQFESFIHPFTVTLTLPLAAIGVFAALLLTGTTINIFSLIGMIMLVGIVTRNAILLVDCANQLRARGLDRLEAVLQAGSVRLRPILMTAITAMVGILPVALGGWHDAPAWMGVLGHTEGGEARAPMGIAVMGGLFTSTLLTLVVIPVVYLIFDEALELGRRIRGAAVLSRAGALPPAPGEEGG